MVNYVCMYEYFSVRTQIIFILWFLYMLGVELNNIVCIVEYKYDENCKL